MYLPNLRWQVLYIITINSNKSIISNWGSQIELWWPFIKETLSKPFFISPTSNIELWFAYNVQESQK